MRGRGRGRGRGNVGETQPERAREAEGEGEGEGKGEWVGGWSTSQSTQQRPWSYPVCSAIGWQLQRVDQVYLTN